MKNIIVSENFNYNIYMERNYDTKRAYRVSCNLLRRPVRGQLYRLQSLYCFP